MSVTIINDLHLGAKRSGGTTPQSALALREYLLGWYAELLSIAQEDLLINGDFLDAFEIDLGDLLKVYDLTCDWLHEHPMSDLIIGRGNHDISKDSSKTSSFDMLCGLLKRRFDPQVTIVTEPTLLRFPGCTAYMIPHVTDQNTFDQALLAVPEVDYLFLHCNYDNMFAVQADHSLNLSVEQAKALPVSTIVIAHEHQAKIALKGKVQIVGNQFPSSVADCLGNDFTGVNVKWAGRISDSGHFERFCSMNLQEGVFAEQGWQNLTEGPQFVRVTGKASAQQASDVIAAISRFRASSNAFVITNAVQIEGVDDEEMILASLEELQGFSVLSALLEILTPEEGVTVKKLLEKQHA